MANFLNGIPELINLPDYSPYASGAGQASSPIGGPSGLSMGGGAAQGNVLSNILGALGLGKGGPLEGIKFGVSSGNNAFGFKGAGGTEANMQNQLSELLRRMAAGQSVGGQAGPTEPLRNAVTETTPVQRVRPRTMVQPSILELDLNSLGQRSPSSFIDLQRFGL